jgi:tetratricopeptide (TPR) repeat protein
MEKENNQFYLIYLFLAFTLLIHLLPFLFPEARMWGFNHLLFLPPLFSYLFGVIGLIALVLPIFKKSNSAGETIATKFNEIFYSSSRKLLNRLILIIAAGALFIIFCSKTHFLGDGYSWLAYLADESASVFKWSEAGAIYLLSLLTDLFGGGESAALTAFRIVTILSGMVTIWFYLAIAGILTDQPIKRFLIFISILFSGTLLLFFGYVEHYPLLWPFLTGFVFYSIKYIRSGNGLYRALIYLFIGSILHMQMLVFVPSLVYVIFSRGKAHQLYKKLEKIFWFIIIVIVAVSVFLFIRRYTADLYFENIFLPLFYGKPVDTGYYLFSLPHIIDIFNLYILLSPLIMLLIILIIKSRNDLVTNKNAIFTSILGLGSFIFLLALDPRLTMPRDWDLFSLSALGPILLIFSLIKDEIMIQLKRFLPAIVIIAVMLPLPYLLTVLKADNSIAYFSYIIDLDKKKSLSSLITLKSYFENKGNTATADSIADISNKRFPSVVSIEQGFEAIETGDLELTKSIIDKIIPDKFNSRYHNLRSNYYAQTGNLNTALAFSDSAITLRPYVAVLYSNRSQILYSLRRYNESLECLRQAYELKSDDLGTIEGLIYTYLKIGPVDSAFHYAEMLSRPPFSSPSSYYFLGQISISIGNQARAREYLEYYIANGTSDPSYEIRAERSKNSLLKMDE